MIDALLEILQNHNSLESFLLLFTPFVLLLELPFLLMVIVGIFLWAYNQKRFFKQPTYFPKVSCALICYSEAEAIVPPILSLAYQLYPGEIEILVVIDGAIQNKKTFEIAKEYEQQINALPNRSYRVIPKWQRGGRVSSMNLALQQAGGEIFMALDGDTTFNNDMVIRAVENFENPDVIAVSGDLKVRNAHATLFTILQSIEYILSITSGRTGLSSFNMVNNISGAFGIFRTKVLRLVGGWHNGTAEDFDLTMRLKEYFGIYPNWRIVFDPMVIGHTEVPESFLGFLNQRIRWEGDLFYILIRRYFNNIRPSMLGKLNYFFTLIGVYFFQVIMPFVITVYTIVMLFYLPFDIFVALGVIVYAFYFGMLLLFFFIYLGLISQNPKEDFEYIFYLPLYPFFTYIARINAALALLHSIVNKSHLDSNMAPWWVLKKSLY